MGIVSDIEWDQYFVRYFVILEWDWYLVRILLFSNGIDI